MVSGARGAPCHTPGWGEGGAARAAMAAAAHWEGTRARAAGPRARAAGAAGARRPRRRVLPRAAATFGDVDPAEEARLAAEMEAAQAGGVRKMVEDRLAELRAMGDNKLPSDMWASLAPSACGTEAYGSWRAGLGGASRGGLKLVCEAPAGADVGDVLLSIPESACLVEPRAPPPGAPDLPWELRLALRLLDSAMGQDPSEAGYVWAAYAGALLPAPAQLSQPSCLSEGLLKEYQEGEEADGVTARARTQQARLREAMPVLSPPAGEDCGPLQWALACVRSRAFACGAGGATGGAVSFGDMGDQAGAGLDSDDRGAPTDRFAMVPFLDIANHADDDQDLNADFSFEALPNAAGEVSSEGEAAPNFMMDPSAAAGGAADGGEPTMGFVLRAVRPIAQGEEVRIKYHSGMDNKRLMAAYGYCLEGNELDRMPLPLPPAAARAARAAADAARERALDAGDAAAARRAMALGASVQDTGADLGAGEDTSTLLLELALALLEDLRSLPTSADEDDAMLASAPLAPPLRAAVAYRAERKRLGRQLADVLMAAADLVDAK